MLNFDQLNEEFKSWYRQIWLDGYNNGLEDGRNLNQPTVITDLLKRDS
jgi:hypothetical protein